MSRKKENVENDASESKEQKFRRISNTRAKKAIYELGRLTNMTSQPSYIILDVDAEKLEKAVSKAYAQFLDVYSKLASGQSIKAGKKEIENIF